MKCRLLCGLSFKNGSMYWRLHKSTHVQPPACIFPSHCCVYVCIQMLLRWESHSQENKRHRKKVAAVILRALWSPSGQRVIFITGRWPAGRQQTITRTDSGHTRRDKLELRLQNNRHKYSSLWEKEYKRCVHPCIKERRPVLRFLFPSPPCREVNAGRAFLLQHQPLQTWENYFRFTGHTLFT